MPVIEAFRLPDLGEGLTEGEIVRWLVAVGQTVTVNQPIVEIETAKALVEIPAKWSGTVTAILHGVGETVPVGTPIIEIETEGASPGGMESPAPGKTGDPEISLLVGYGPSEAPGDWSGSPAPRRSFSPGLNHARPRAKPPVRKLARDLGVDLSGVVGTGPNGSITRDDVHSLGSQPLAVPGAAPASRVEPNTRVPVTGIRRLTAEHMAASARTVPHATLFLAVDVTRSMVVLDRLRELPAWEGVRASALLLVAKAVLAAMPRHPLLNATWAEKDIIVHEQVNLGIAVATARGLLVPNIKEANRRSSLDLAREIRRVATSAREGDIAPGEVRGGTFSITNIGVFGVESGTPLVPVGQTAILAVGAIREAPWAHKGKIKSRKVVTLSLSFDHRVIDGAEGSGFLRDVADFLTDPAVFLLAWS